ncbi:dihydrofolate reductase [Haloarchaeobius iranensis]|uniref:dihydrofolate reductase n=1 Tax=Haloarchaeobius iranensis TaxID=996166 RepID=A0A1G9ZBK3_9EURY|nr:dihydrofolate reductase [Haloarchaeobius iranensis]SDN18840.1 dihydrofolate reductase [Haloarchaeobius iranensis]
MDVIAVAAVSENGVIGDGPTLPWSLPAEVRRYRERVADDVVVIGRRTFEMFDDPPGAHQLVLSRSDREYADPSVTHAGGVRQAVSIASEQGAPVLYVLGGSAIYEAFLSEYDRMLLSRIEGEFEGDAHFPEFDGDEWELVAETQFDGYVLEEWVPASGGD